MLLYFFNLPFYLLSENGIIFALCLICSQGKSSHGIYPKNTDVGLVIATFQKAYENRNAPYVPFGPVSPIYSLRFPTAVGLPGRGTVLFQKGASL